MWQPIFATMDDSKGCGKLQTRSLRGLVYNINFWINSEIGEVGRINVDIDNRTDYDFNRHNHCKDRLAFFTLRDNKKKIEYWKTQLKICEELKAEEDKRKVRCYLSLNDKTKMQLEFNGLVIDNKVKEVLNLLKMTENIEIAKDLLLRHLKCLEGL